MPPTIRDEQEIDKKSIDLRLMARLLGFLRPYWPWAASTLLLILAASLARQAGPVLTKIAVDEHIVPGDLDGLGTLVLLFAALLVAQFVIGYAQSWITSMVGQWTMRDVRLNIFTCLQHLPLKFFDRTPIGRLMARNTSDVDALNEFFTYGAVSLVTETVTIASILFYIFYYLRCRIGSAHLRFFARGLCRHPVAAKPHLPSLPPSPHPLCPLQRRFAGNLVGYRSSKTVQLRAAQHPPL